MTLPNEKIAHMTNGAKNRPHDNAKNRPQDGLKNRPDIINPVCLRGVITEGSLKALLMSKGQTAWCSRVRLLGLLLLIDYMLRHIKRGRISMSADFAHQFVSKLRRRTSVMLVTEPLLLLCEIGILRKLRPAVLAHVKTSAVYCLGDFRCPIGGRWSVQRYGDIRCSTSRSFSGHPDSAITLILFLRKAAR